MVIMLCPACSAGVANDDWSHVENEEAYRDRLEFARAAGWLTLAGSNASDAATTCDCCGIGIDVGTVRSYWVGQMDPTPEAVRTLIGVVQALVDIDETDTARSVLLAAGVASAKDAGFFSTFDAGDLWLLVYFGYEAAALRAVRRGSLQGVSAALDAVKPWANALFPLIPDDEFVHCGHDPQNFVDVD